MRKFPFITIALLLAATVLSACFKDSDGENGKYANWNKANQAWIIEQSNLVDEKTGKSYYKECVAPWDADAKVYIHWYNDTNLTRDNLKPFYTSMVDVKYKGRLYDGTPFDSSYLRTSPAAGVYRTRLGSNVIEGWSIALMNMHVGDTCRVLLPYNVAYGSNGSGSVIKPFSALQFELKLENIYKLEE